jgi:hypothetical protein
MVEVMVLTALLLVVLALPTQEGAEEVVRILLDSKRVVRVVQE